MGKPTMYFGKEYKPLDITHDLSKVDRSYLREQGISEESFKRMDPVSQGEWKDECRIGAYEHIRKLKGRTI